MPTLQNKVAIVTGASSGIGRAAAKLFALNGAKVVVAARRRELLDQLVDEIGSDGGHATAVGGDIGEEAFHQELAEKASRQYGGLNIAFNNAGIMGKLCPAQDLSLEEWNETIATNLTSGFLAAKHQLPLMQKAGGGSLIFTSSFVGYTVGMPSMAAYAAAKAGLIGLVQVLASEFGSQKIRVNALLPGGTDTPMGQSVANTPEMRAFVENLHALKRIAQPEEIAQSALYLASDAASFTTGTAMLVDGGVSITRT